jgi:hypothetical protein
MLSEWNDRRHAEAILKVAKSIRVGESTVTDVLKAATTLRGLLDVRKGVDQDHFPVETIPISSCRSADCVLFFHLAPSDAPTTLYHLQAKYPALRKTLRVNTLMLTVSTSKGIVQRVEVTAQTIDDKTANEATATISNNKHDNPWSVKTVGGIMEGETNVGTHSIEIEATVAADATKKNQAFDFDVGCLRITRHCSPCSLLPFACQEYEHGGWFYFQMPEGLLIEFQTAVNALPLGVSQDAVANRLGWAGLFNRTLFEDKLPFHFPDGAMSGDSDPRRLIYYVRRHREHQYNPEDQTVTLTFENDKLVRIKSEIAGFKNRP